MNEANRFKRKDNPLGGKDNPLRIEKEIKMWLLYKIVYAWKSISPRKWDRPMVSFETLRDHGMTQSYDVDQNNYYYLTRRKTLVNKGIFCYSMKINRKYRQIPVSWLRSKEAVWYESDCNWCTWNLFPNALKCELVNLISEAVRPYRQLCWYIYIYI